MTRQPLGNGRWFDLDSAESWQEGRFHDGRNMISRATGSQWDHEKLYRSKSGTWIMRRWSQWQGSRETWRIVDADEACRWLIENDHEDDAKEIFPALFAELEA